MKPRTRSRLIVADLNRRFLIDWLQHSEGINSPFGYQTYKWKADFLMKTFTWSAVTLDAKQKDAVAILKGKLLEKEIPAD